MALIKSRKSVEPPTSPEVDQESRELPRGVATAGSPQAESEIVADSIGSLLNRVADSSVQEIDRLIAELQTLRRLLQSEGARVQREIAEYATLSQSAMQTTDLITENIAKLKSDADATTLGRYDDLQRQERCRASTGLRPDGAAVSLVQKDDGQRTPTGAPARSL